MERADHWFPNWFFLTGWIMVWAIRIDCMSTLVLECTENIKVPAILHTHSAHFRLSNCSIRKNFWQRSRKMLLKKPSEIIKTVLYQSFFLIRNLLFEICFEHFRVSILRKKILSLLLKKLEMCFKGQLHQRVLQNQK